MESSNPAVVTKATLAPLRCNRVLVPTVVPCKTRTSMPAGAILATASAMAWEGSAGVEKTFNMRRLDFSSQTQSVNVPPLSIAILKGLSAGISHPGAQGKNQRKHEGKIKLVILTWHVLSDRCKAQQRQQRV